MVDRVLYSFLEFEFDLFETTNVVPCNGWHLDDGFSERRGVGSAKGKSEVVHGNTKGVENFSIDGVLVEINQIHLFSNLLHGGFGTQRSDIRTNVTMGIGCNLYTRRRSDFGEKPTVIHAYLLQIDIIGQLHVLGVDAKNLQSSGWVWNTDIDFTIKTTKATERRVDRVGSVGGSHDNNV